MLLVELGKLQKQAWVAFYVSHMVLSRKIESALDAAGQPSLEVYDVLLRLELADGHGLKMSELASHILYSRSGLTRLVDRLVKLGWIERMACPKDRRSIYARLTPAGLTAREAAWPVYRAAIQEHFGSKISEAEANEVARVFGRFTDGLVVD